LSHTPFENRVVRALLRCALWLVLAVSAYWSLRLAWADHLSYGAELAGRERAVELAPTAAVFAERLAGLRDELGGDGLPDLRRAAMLDPENPERRMRLGVRAELAGDYPLAERSLLAAATRSRLYQPKYLLAQYYFRRQNASQFFWWARAALETAWGDATPLFDLGWRMRPDAAWLSANLIPPRRETVQKYLAYLTHCERWEAATGEARKLLPAARSADLERLLAYGEARLSRGDASQAVELWNALCLRHLLSLEPLDPSGDQLITNGDFLQVPSGRGFDWRLTEQPGVTARAEGGRLRVSFTGGQPERCTIVWQYIATSPAVRYRLRWEARTDGGEPASGIAWAIPDVRLGPASADSQEFVAAKDLTRISLIYQRPAGRARLEGTVWMGHVRLGPAP
jgi:hypothetical protein